MPVTRPADIDKMLAEFRELAHGGAQAALAGALGAESLALVKHGFDVGESPTGQKWPPPVFRPGGQPLLLTARLRNAWGVRFSPTEVELENPTDYANIQNFGGVVTPKNAKALRYKVQGGFRFSKRSVIPRRQMIPDEGDLPQAWAVRLERVADKVIRHYTRTASE